MYPLIATQETSPPDCHHLNSALPCVFLSFHCVSYCVSCVSGDFVVIGRPLNHCICDCDCVYCVPVCPDFVFPIPPWFPCFSPAFHCDCLAFLWRSAHSTLPLELLLHIFCPIAVPVRCVEFILCSIRSIPSF